MFGGISRMDNSLASYLLNDIEHDGFLCQQYERLLSDYVDRVFYKKSLTYDNAYQRLLRYAEILSLSDVEAHQNLAQQIVILLSALFPLEDDVLFYKEAVYINVSNFVSAQMIHPQEVLTQDDILRSIETEVHKNVNRIPDSDKLLFNAQHTALSNLNSNQFFSFSAPTSMGKTFIITNYIREKIREGTESNFVILVPTRALLSEIAGNMIEQFQDYLGIGKHKVITSMSSLSEGEKYVAVLTPERFYSSLLKQPDIEIGYVFVDEAHKISDRDKRSVIYYKILDILKERGTVHIFFSSPLIPNPDVYLELTNYYSEVKSKAAGKRFVFSPVSQNKIYLDLNKREISIYNGLSNTIILCGQLPASIKKRIDALLVLGKNKCNLIYVSSASKAISLAKQFSDTVEQAEKLKCKSDDRFKDDLEEVAKQIEERIHKEYYLADLIRRRIAFHIGALPAEIRLKIEELIKKGAISYCFCTSTLLEGVNVPVDNLFVFDHKKATSNLSEIDALNLMGRAGRVSLNEYGNVYLLIENAAARRYYDDVILNDIPAQKLLPSKALAKKHKKLIVETLLQGKTNLLLEGEKYADKDFTETTYDYAAKCLNMLLHDICAQKDSYIVQDFKKHDVITPQQIIDIRKRFGSIVSEDDDINIAARQKESLYSVIENSDLSYPNSFDYYECLSFLKKLSKVFQWPVYEKYTLGKGDRLSYYTVILCQWMQGKGLHEIIRGAIKHYEDTNGQLVSYEPMYHLEPYNHSSQHKNQIMNDAMKDIEQIVNYKFLIYFLRFSEAIIKVRGQDSLKNDWYEYVEYGTSNDYVIALQKYGFLREEALVLTKAPYLGYIDFTGSHFSIKKDIIKTAPIDLRNSIVRVMINYPEVFVE